MYIALSSDIFRAPKNKKENKFDFSMSRHRNVRSMNYSEGLVNVLTFILSYCRLNENNNLFVLYSGHCLEYDGYDDVYGHSMDEDSCMSPTDAQQFLYDRNRGQQSVASFMTNNKDIKEETDEETDAVADELYKKLRRDSDVRKC